MLGQWIWYRLKRSSSKRLLQLSTHLSVHGSHGFGDTFHCLSHGVVRFECLYLKGHGLDVSPHHDEFLDIAPCSHQIFSHDFHSILKWENQVRKQIHRFSSGGFQKPYLSFLSKLTICPCLAIFLMSAMIFFSWVSSFCRSRSNSRMARFRARWFCRSISSGVFRRPNNRSILTENESAYNSWEKGRCGNIKHIGAKYLCIKTTRFGQYIKKL